MLQGQFRIQVSVTPEFEKRLAEAVADHDKVVELLTDPLRIKDLEMHTPTHNEVLPY